MPDHYTYYRMTTVDGYRHYFRATSDNIESFRKTIVTWDGRDVTGIEFCPASEAWAAWGLAERSIDPGVMAGCREA